MANISAIKLPNGTTYNIKDSISGYTTNTGTITKVQTTAGAHTTINVSSGAATFNVPTKTSHLTNDSGFITNAGVTGVKGNAENSYRTGQVNLTPANLGAIAKNETGNTQELRRPASLAGTNDVTLDGKINTLRANRLAFLPADQIIIEKTTDGGTTWTSANVSDTTKVQLFSEVRAGVALPLLNGKKSSLCGLRITFTGMKYNVPANTAETSKYNYWNSNYILSTERYCQLKEMYFWISVSGGYMNVKVERATGANSTNWVTIFDNPNFNMTGYDGNDYISFSQATFGGGTNQTSNYWNYRITFMTDDIIPQSPYDGYSQSVSEIRAYGDTAWTKPDNYMANDHLYSFDYQKNATFPAKVTANGGFSGNLTGNVTGNVSGSAGSVAWSGITSKPTTISGYGITDAKIASGVITLGSNTITPLTSSSTLNAAKLSGAIPSAVTATTQASTDNSTKIATTAYVTTAIANLPEPMIFKGSVGTGGTITSLPAAAASNEGWTYKVITALSSPEAKVGDTVISNGSSWVVIPSGDEPSGTVTSVGVSNATNGGLTISSSPITSSGTITIGHSNVLTNAQTTQAVYPIKIDKNGHISAYGSAVTIPAITLNGVANTSPSFYAPTTAGTNGYVLTSNGSGTPTWTSATLTDEKVQATALTSGTLYYPILATGTGTATRQIDSTLKGLTYKSTAGTTSAVGTAQLTIGNSTASGTANNEQGQIILYGSTAYAHTIVGAPTAARTITLPNATGTLALNTVVTAGTSPSSGGLMSQLDKTKLDSIASNAAAVQIIRWTESS